MKASRMIRMRLCAVLLLGLVMGRPRRMANAAWSSYLHSLSSTTTTSPPPPPVATAPPSTQIASEEVAPSNAADFSATRHQGDYLSYLSSPRPILTTYGATLETVGHQPQPVQPTQPAAVQEILKSTTGTDYLSRLSSTGSTSVNPSPSNVVYVAVPAVGKAEPQAVEKSALGSTDYLSQLSGKRRNRPSTPPAAPALDAAPIQIGSSSSFPSSSFPSTSTAPLTDTQNGANFLSFLTSRSVPSTSTSTEDDQLSGSSAKTEEVRDTTGSSYLQHLSSPPDAEPSVSKPNSKVSPLSTKSSSAASGSSSSSKSKSSYSPFGTKPQSVQASSFSAVGTSYMNFLGTGPTPTSWYAEPLYVKPPPSRRKVETQLKNEAKLAAEISEGASPPEARTDTSKDTIHYDAPVQMSHGPASYLSSLSRPTTPVAMTASSESVPTGLQTQADGGAGYLASLGKRNIASVPTRTDPPRPDPVPHTAVSIPNVDYLSSLSGSPSPKSVPLETTVTASAPANYLESLSGTNTMEFAALDRDDASMPSQESSKANFSPFGWTPKAVTESGYLAGLSGKQAKPSSNPPYANEVNISPTTYAPFGRIPKAATQTGYLNDLAGRAPATSSPAMPSSSQNDYSPFGKMPKAVSPPAGYLRNLASTEICPSSADGSSASQKKSYSPFGTKPKAVVSTGYLSGLSTSTTTTLDAPGVDRRKNFSPFGTTPRAVKETGYLSTLAHPGSPPTLSDRDAAAEPAVAAPKSYSPFGRKPTGDVATGYLGSLSGGPQIHATSRSQPAHVETKTDAVLYKPDPKPQRGVLKPMASYHPVSGALVEIKSSR